MLVKRQARKINREGFIIDVIAVIEGQEKEDEIVKEFPSEILFKPRWFDGKWIEGATQEEIDELNKPIDIPPADTEILGQQMTEREIESMVQGQQITDIELRLLGMEVARNV